MDEILRTFEKVCRQLTDIVSNDVSFRYESDYGGRVRKNILVSCKLDINRTVLMRFITEVRLPAFYFPQLMQTFLQYKAECCVTKP